MALIAIYLTMGGGLSKPNAKLSVAFLSAMRITTQFMRETGQKTRLPVPSSWRGNFSERDGNATLPSHIIPTRKLIIHPPKLPFAENMRTFRTEIKRRRELMMCQCKKITRTTSSAELSRNPYRYLHVFDKENIVYCPVIKASTSTWKRNLLRLSYLPKDKIEEWLSRPASSSQGWKSMLQNYCKYGYYKKVTYERFLHSKKAGVLIATILLRIVAHIKFLTQESRMLAKYENLMIYYLLISTGHRIVACWHKSGNSIRTHHPIPSW